VVWIALFFSLVACCLSGFFYWRFRRKQEMSVDQFSNKISGLMSEFNSVTASKVDLLDDRTEELRRIVDLANLKIKKLNELMDDVESLENTLDREAKDEGSPVEETESSRQQRVLELAESGKTPTEIARDTELTPGEVSVILKVNDGSTVAE